MLFGGPRGTCIISRTFTRWRYQQAVLLVSSNMILIGLLLSVLHFMWFLVELCKSQQNRISAVDISPDDSVYNFQLLSACIWVKQILFIEIVQIANNIG